MYLDSLVVLVKFAEGILVIIIHFLHGRSVDPVYLKEGKVI